MILSGAVRVRSNGIHWSVEPSMVNAFRELAETVSNRNSLEPVKQGMKKSVYRTSHPDGKRMVYLKVYIRDMGRYLFSSPPAQREADAMKLASKAGVGTPDLVGFGFKRVFPFSIESCLLTVSPGDTVTLGAKWADALAGTSGDEDRRMVTADLVRLLSDLRRLHDSGLGHYDMHPGNVLLDRETDRLIFIDFHRWRRLAGRDAEGRARDLLKIYMFLKPWISWEEWEGFVKGYGGDNRSLCCDILAVWSKTEEKLLSRRLAGVAGACLGSRKGFVIHREDDMTVRYRSEYSRDDVLRIARGERGPLEWNVERREYLSLAGGLAAGMLGRGQRGSWVQSVKANASGLDDVLPVALVEKWRGPRLISDILITDGEGKAPYSLERQFDLSIYKE